MLNTEEEVKKYVTNCINCLPVVFIARPSENSGIQVVMLPITKEQEEQLDNGESLLIETDRGTFNVNPDLCYAYGKFDLSPNSNDILTMYKANWFSSLEIKHSIISDYDYEQHCGISDRRGGRWYNTSNLKDYLPYLHGCLGKPERIVIFKEYLNSVIQRNVKRKARIKAKQKSETSSQSSDYRKEQNKAKTEAKRKAKVSGLKFNIKK